MQGATAASSRRNVVAAITPRHAPVTRRGAILATCSALAFPRRAQAVETVKIGQMAPLTGPAAEAGLRQVNGAKQAAETVNAAGGVLGRPVELLVEDDQSTNPGGVLAFSRLSARGDLVGFLASQRSTLLHAIAPDVQKVAKPTIMAGTDPMLTRLGYRWMFRVRPNDRYSARVIADFGITALKKQKWAIVHSTDAFGVSAVRAVADALDTHAVKPVLTQGYTNQQPDFTPTVLAIKQSGADVICSYFTFENDLALFARQLRQLGVGAVWIGSPTITYTTSLKLAGNALNGTYGVTDFAADANSEARAFADRFEELYKEKPDSGAAWTYDGLMVLATAINQAGSTDPEKVRSAVLAIQGFKGVEGEYRFDENGDGLHGYNIVRNEGGRFVFARHIEFAD